MKNLKNAISCVLILSLLSVGCGTKELHYIYLPAPVSAGNENIKKENPSYHKRSESSPYNDIRASLFSEIVTKQLEVQKRNAFLVSALIYLIKADHSNKLIINDDYMEQLMRLDANLVLFKGSTVIDHLSETADSASARYAQFLEQQSQMISEKQFNSFELLNLIEKSRWELKTKDHDAALKIVNKQIDEWAPQISKSIFSIVFQNESLTNAFNDVIGESKSGLIIVPKLNSNLKEIAKFLPELTETQKVIKSELSRVNELNNDIIGFSEKVQSAMLKDVNQAAKEIKIIIKNKKAFEQAQDVYGRIDSALNLGASVSRAVFGPNKELDQFVNTARMVLKVSKAVCSINFVKIGANLATGNILSAVNDVVGGLMGLSSGPDPQIMEMLESIRNDIADFRNHVDMRFDELLNKLDQQLLLLKENQVALEDIQFTLRNMTESLSQISQKIDQGFDSIFENQFKYNYISCFKSSLAIDTDYNHLRECADYFFSYAISTSEISQQTGEFAFDMDVPYLSIDASLDQYGILNKFGFMDIAIAALLLPKKKDGSFQKTTNLHHINVSDFIMGTENYLNLLQTYPLQFGIKNSSIHRVFDNINILKKKASVVQASLLKLSDSRFLSSVVNEYFDQAFASLKSDQIRSDLEQLRIKHKLMLNLLKVVDPLNVYKTMEFEDLFDMSGKSGTHVDLLSLTHNGAGYKFDSSKINNFESKLRKERFMMTQYLDSRYKASNYRGHVTTLIDPVLEHIESMLSAVTWSSI